MTGPRAGFERRVQGALDAAQTCDVLLGVLERRTFRRLGGTEVIKGHGRLCGEPRRRVHD